MISFNHQVIFLISSHFILLVPALIIHIIIPITWDFNFISSEIVKGIISSAQQGTSTGVVSACGWILSLSEPSRVISMPFLSSTISIFNTSLFAFASNLDFRDHLCLGTYLPCPPTSPCYLFQWPFIQETTKYTCH